MAVALHWEERGVVARFSGPFTPDDALHSATRISSDERLDDLRYVLLDFGGVERCDIPPEDVRALDLPTAIAIGTARSNPAILIAVVVADDADHESYRARFGVMPFLHKLFTVEHEARDWIRSARVP